MKRAIYGLFLALMTALPAAAQDKAPEPWYEVEIILFEHLDPAAPEAEQWPIQVVRPEREGSIELLRAAPAADGAQNTTADGAVPYLILPPEQYRLRKAYQKLLDSDAYLPYVHVAWRQIIPPRETPDRIFIHDRLNAAPEAETADADLIPPSESAPSAAAIFAADMSVGPPQTFTPPEHTLSGIISIGLGRYLHVNADLLLYKPRPDQAAPAQDAPPANEPFTLDPLPLFGDVDETLIEEMPDPELFRIQGSLRMRSGEVHYLDHPLAGMLILFTPYTPPPAAAAEVPAAAGTPFVDINQSRPSLQQ